MKISKSIIRNDLKDIRYYYSRKNSFDKATTFLGENSVVELVEKYKKIIVSAPPKLFDLYIALYTENNTQYSLTEKWGYSIQHMSRLNCELVDYLYQQLNKEENENVQWFEVKNTI